MPCDRALASTSCTPFEGPHYILPGANGKSGNTYRISVTNDPMGCARATTWAKKLMSTPTHGLGTPIDVSGPKGYKCAITPDGSGGAMGGQCHRSDAAGNIISSFDWLAAPKS
jgi:hypothetical protein